MNNKNVDLSQTALSKRILPFPSSNIINNEDESDYLTFSGFESVCHPKLNCEDDESGSQVKDAYDIRKVSVMSDEQILEHLRGATNMSCKMNCLQVLQQRHGPAFDCNGRAVCDYIQELYTQASYTHNWSTVRQGAALLDKTVASLAPSVTAMLVAGKQVRNVFKSN